MPDLKVVSLELNEVNFDFIKGYIADGKLPNFAALLKRHKLHKTIAEKGYPHLEPWIQWPTVYTGKPYHEHQVFRLGDIIKTKHDQIWETLERRDLRVGAISPMNAANNCSNAVFFVPDPWTVTPVTGDRTLKELSEIVSTIVNGNAHGNISTGTLARFALAFVRTVRPSSLPTYLKYLRLSRKYKWAKALILDRLLADILIQQLRKDKPDYSSLFLNAGAHIQHHHMYESGAYHGPNQNPEWYSRAGKDGVDPVLTAYRCYDDILGEFLRIGGIRYLISTGLSQKPNPTMIYQYRFIDHGATLGKLGVEAQVIPRMSRDFLLKFPSPEAAEQASVTLTQWTCQGQPFLEIEKRHDELFCKICYFGPPEGLTETKIGSARYDMSQETVLVSIENGIHQTIGYHIDTGIPADGNEPEIPLTSLFAKTVALFDSPAIQKSI